MQTLRKSTDRGHINLGWLDTYHTFSFGQFYDPKHMHYKSLRVINEDKVAPNKGFGEHPHDNMEIITYIVSGGLSHKDSMGHTRTIFAGDIQVMSAGTVITHSEFNDSKDETVHLLQIWIMPKLKGIKPRYIDISANDIANKVSNNQVILVSPDDYAGVNIGLTTMNQDAWIIQVQFENKGATLVNIPEAKHYWIQVVSGIVEINDIVLNAGDGFSLDSETGVNIQSIKNALALVFCLT